MIYSSGCDQVKIAVYDWNPKACDTVVLVHGWPLSSKIFEYQTNLLVARGCRVVGIDLRGFGNSDAPACGYGYTQMAQDIYGVVRMLNLRAFTLVGFSMGGAIALRYMNVCHGYGVKKLALLGAAAPRYTQCAGYPYGVTKESVDDLIEQAKTDRAQLSKDFSRKLLYGSHSDAIKDWFQDISLSASGVGTIAAARSLRDEDGRGDMKCVQVPTAIFHGKKDAIVPFELGELQHNEIKCSVLYPFENSGHGVFYDELETFNQLFLQFVMM